VIDFTEANHEYRVGKRILPSVTRIIVAAGHLRTVDDAAALQRGRAVHEVTRMWDMRTLVASSVDPQIAGYLESWIALRKSKPMRMLAYERKVACVRYGYAGRYDNDVVMDDERFILEKKSGDVQEGAARMQTVAYAEARRLELARTSKRKERLGRIVVRIFPDGRMAHLTRFPATDYQRDLSAFLSALNLYQWSGRYE
jgi:hypothetical protein